MYTYLKQHFFNISLLTTRTHAHDNTIHNVNMSGDRITVKNINTAPSAFMLNSCSN